VENSPRELTCLSTASVSATFLRHLEVESGRRREE